MKYIIAGSRNFDDYLLLEKTLNSINITEIVCGEAKGADTLGKLYADKNSIKVESFKPDWERFGKKAGMLRNEEMGIYADGAVIFWDGVSRGTKHMIEFMRKQKKPLKIVMFNDDEDEWL